MSKTKKVLTATLAVLLLLSALASCAGVRARESQFPLARQVWTSVKPLADAGAPAVPGAEVEIARLDTALRSADRGSLALVAVPLVREAADGGVDILVRDQSISAQVAEVLRSRNAMFAELITKIGGGL